MAGVVKPKACELKATEKHEETAVMTEVTEKDVQHLGSRFVFPLLI